MSTAILDEIIEKSAELSIEERRELIQLLQKQQFEKQAEERAKKPKINNNYIPSLNTVWLKENGHKYKGFYVALYEGELIATGRTIKEADLAAKGKGVKKPLLHYIPAENEELWGGW